MAEILNKSYLKPKEKYPKIKMSLFPVLNPDFKNQDVKISDAIYGWLKSWIEKNVKSGAIKCGYTLPLKADLAYYFGVGTGTMQYAIRKLEDDGIVSSKQRIGTIIALNDNGFSMPKLTSKRETTAMLIKKYIFDNNLKKGDKLPSMKEFMEMYKIKRGTIKGALDFLVFQGILSTDKENFNSNVWFLEKKVSKNDFAEDTGAYLSQTLAEKIAVKLENYITDNLKTGDRLDSLHNLSKKFNMSVKTVYQSVQILVNKGIIGVHRGRYGMVITKMPNESGFQPTKESSIFLTASQAAVYAYARIENTIKNNIRTNYEVGQKLPAMQKLAEEMDVSTNTIRKAMSNLAEQGYVRITCGRFGGIFVTDIPEQETQSFRWLAVNPQYVKAYKN